MSSTTLTPAPTVAEKPQSWIRRKYTSFDGLRGVAITAVFLRHYGVVVFPGVGFESGWVGVDLFFVLSGFLITGILFDSRSETHFYRTFYIRRALRIWPLYYAFFGIITIFRFLHLAAGSKLMYSYPLYLGNIVLQLFYGNPYHNPAEVDLTFGRLAFGVSLGYLWSLCVEEHFYLIWPMVVHRFPKRETLMRIALYGIVGTLALRLAIFAFCPTLRRHGVVYSVTITRWDELMMGAWLALYLRGQRLTREKLRTASLKVIGACCAVLAVGLSLTLHHWPDGASNPFVGTIGYDLIGLTSAAILLLSLDDSNLLSKALRWKPLANLGRVSYGFYILHAIPEYPIKPFLEAAPKFVATAVILAVFFATWAISELSFRYFELPFLKLKDRWAPASHINAPS